MTEWFAYCGFCVGKDYYIKGNLCVCIMFCVSYIRGAIVI